MTWGRKFVPLKIREGLVRGALEQCNDKEKVALKKSVKLIDEFLTITSEKVLELINKSEEYAKVIREFGFDAGDDMPTTGESGTYGKGKVVSEPTDTRKANRERKITEMKLKHKIEDEKQKLREKKNKTEDKSPEKKDNTEKKIDGSKEESKDSEESKESETDSDEDSDKPKDLSEESDEDSEDSDEGGEDSDEGGEDSDKDGGDSDEDSDVGNKPSDKTPESFGDDDGAYDFDGSLEDEVIDTGESVKVDQARVTGDGEGAIASMGIVIRKVIQEEMSGIDKDITVDMRNILESSPPPFRLSQFDLSVGLTLAEKIRRMTTGLQAKTLFHQKHGRVHLIEAMKFRQTHNLRIFKRNLKDQTGKARMAVAILVDGSGSMGYVNSHNSKKNIAVRTCYMIARELEKLGHLVEIRGFGDHDVLIKKFRQKHADWSEQNWRHTGCGNEDTCSSIVAARDDLNRVGKLENIETKVLMLFGDGQWDDNRAYLHHTSGRSVQKEIIKANKENVVTVFMRYEDAVANERTEEDKIKAKLECKIFEHLNVGNMEQELIVKLTKILTEVEKQVIRKLMKWRMK
jgi:hypothetical protein